MISSFKDSASYYWINLLVILYALHSLITTSNKSYILIFIVFIALMIYDMFKKYKDEDVVDDKKREEFISYMIKLTKEDDERQGEKMRTYKLAQIILRSNSLLWKTLLKSKKYFIHDTKSIENVFTLLIHFLEKYGILLKTKKTYTNDYTVLHEMYELRNNVLNAVEELDLQSSFTQLNQKNTKQLSIVMIAFLDKCIRVLRNKFKSFHALAPLPINLAGNEQQLY
jgi:hypothetical protein